MPLNEEVVDSVANSNFKVLSDVVAHSMGLALQNAVSHQHAINQISAAVLLRGLRDIVEMNPSEAVSTQKTLSGNDLAQQMTQLMAALAANQQANKAAGNTPPVTP